MVKVAILHEGKANKSYDNKLLNLLLHEINLDKDNVKFIGMGCKSNFFKKDSEGYKLLKINLDSEQLSKVLFVLDADNDRDDRRYGGYQNTETELRIIIKELELEDLSDIYITCDPVTKCGYLESLILSSIPAEQEKCINYFLECSNFKSKENHKAILNQIYKIAYPKSPYDFSHKNFDVLKSKLKKLFEVA